MCAGGEVFPPVVTAVTGPGPICTGPPSSWSRPLTELTSLSLAPSLKHAQGGNASWSGLPGEGELAVFPRTGGSPVQPRLELGQGGEDVELWQAEAAAESRKENSAGRTAGGLDCMDTEAVSVIWGGRCQ